MNTRLFQNIPFPQVSSGARPAFLPNSPKCTSSSWTRPGPANALQYIILHLARNGYQYLSLSEKLLPSKITGTLVMVCQRTWVGEGGWKAIKFLKKKFDF